MDIRNLKKFSVLLALCLLVFGCAVESSNKLRAKQLLLEINEIAVEPRSSGAMAKVMKVSERFSENKKDFPAKRDNLKTDAKFLVGFFEKSIAQAKEIIRKFEELLTLNLAKPEADCIRHSIKFQGVSIEQIKVTITQFEVFFDEAIKDKDTLDSRLRAITEKLDKLNEKVTEIEKREDKACAGRNKWNRIPNLK